MAKTSPTQRSLKLLRSEGWVAQVVEKYNVFAHIRQDLFNFIDIVCIRSNVKGVLGVQTTTQTNGAGHMKKIKASVAYKIWLAGGNQIELHLWAKRGKAGKRKLWTVNRIVIQ